MKPTEQKVASERRLESHPHIAVMNAVEQAALHPNTFKIDDYRDVKVGDYVKACFTQDGLEISERMWSLVQEITADGVYVCVLDNDPEFVAMVCGCTIHLRGCEIMNRYIE